MRNPKNTCLPMLITPVIGIGARGRRIPRGSNLGSVGNFGAIESACTRVGSIASKLSILAVLRLFFVLLGRCFRGCLPGAIPGRGLRGPGIAPGLRNLALGAGAFLALVVPPAHAGYWYDGRCWSSLSDLANAVEVDYERTIPFFAHAASGAGMSYSYGNMRLVCLTTTPATVPASVGISCASVYSGRFGQPAVLTGTGVSSATTPYGSTSTFYPPVCDVPSSDSDQVSAVNALFGPALALLAAVWGGKLLFSLLWSRSSRRDPSDSEG